VSYLKKREWEVIPENKPAVRRYCPKCGDKTQFINTGKFRINANKGLLDIWLIYQCSRCKATWNLSIYERINPEAINREEYDKFLTNNKELAESYGYDISIHHRNKAELILEAIDYRVIAKEMAEYATIDNEQEIKLCCKYPIQLRVDKLLSAQLNISRSQVKKLCQKGIIYNCADKDLFHARIEDDMVICIKSPENLSF
jgi:hypothetical protein